MNPTLIPLVVWGERPVTTYPSKSVSSDCPPSFHLPSFLVQRDSSQWYLNETVPENIPSFASLLRSNHSKGLSLLNTQTIGHQHSWIFFATLTLHEIPWITPLIFDHRSPLTFFLDWLFSIDNVLPLDQERDSISDAFKQIESLNA